MFYAEKSEKTGENSKQRSLGMKEGENDDWRTGGSEGRAQAEPLNRPVRDKRALAKSPNCFQDFIAIFS